MWIIFIQKLNEDRSKVSASSSYYAHPNMNCAAYEEALRPLFLSCFLNMFTKWEFALFIILSLDLEALLFHFLIYFVIQSQSSLSNYGLVSFGNNSASSFLLNTALVNTLICCDTKRFTNKHVFKIFKLC